MNTEEQYNSGLTKDQLRVIKTALIHAMENETETTFPEQLSYFNTKSQKFISKPTKDKLESGEVVAMADPEKTFSHDNMKVSYTSKVSKEMVYSIAILNSLDLSDGQESKN